MAYVYIYEVPSLDAVKIGKTSGSSKDRMWDYAEEHNFSPRASSLRTIHVGENAYHDIETILHRKISLNRMRWGNATELFHTGGRSYQAIYEEMIGIIDRSIDNKGHVKVVSNINWGRLIGSGLTALFSGGRRSSGFGNAVLKEVFGIKKRRRSRWF